MFGHPSQAVGVGALMTVAAAAWGDAAPAPLTIVSARPLPALTAAFRSTEGWTGGDGASSLPLGNGTTLWLFADSFVGRICDGRRHEARMVNNAAAWQPGGRLFAPLRFFVGDRDGQPASLLTPAAAATWYWPGDGAVVGGRLYLFAKQVRHKPDQAPGFGFDWFADALLEIANPHDPPPAWSVKHSLLPGAPEGLRLASGSLVGGTYLYAWGLFPEARCGWLDRPVGLARIPCDKLSDMRAADWEYWSEGAEGPRWSRSGARPVPLFRDGAAEMSVSHVRGVPGLVAVYTRLGLGAEIVLRHAKRPEGPWSDPAVIYRCPEDPQQMLLYGAKAHPELATEPGLLVVTYCRNIGSLADHMAQPEVYFPQAVEVRLRPTP